MRLSDSGWRLFAPTDVDLDGTFRDALLDGTWLFFALVLAGYWTSFTASGVRKKPALAVAVFLAPALAVGYGLVLVPRALDLAPVAWWEIGTAVGAFLLAASSPLARAGDDVG